VSEVSDYSYLVERISELSNRVDELWKTIMKLSSELSEVKTKYEACRKEIVKIGYILSDLAEEIAIIKAYVKDREK